MCGGRTFKVASSTKIDGRWRLTIGRVKDDALELWFPYKDYPIKNGDHFVLTGITLPDSYVNAASLKLLKYAIAFIDERLHKVRLSSLRLMRFSWQDSMILLKNHYRSYQKSS